MSASTFEKICGIVGTILVTIFILGLATSISRGFAGFWGGLPFWVISLSVLFMVFYDLWVSCLQKKD
jgi:hypothetical protein